MTCKFLHHFVAYFVQDKMWVSLQKFFKDRPELKQHRTAQQRRKYFADSGIEMMPNKQGEEGVLLNVQETGTMMVRVGRKMSSSKEKVEKHENQASQDAKHAKLSSQLEVKSYDKEVLEAAHQSSSSDSYSSSSSDDTSDSEESGFGLSAKKMANQRRRSSRHRLECPQAHQAAAKEKRQAQLQVPQPRKLPAPRIELEKLQTMLKQRCSHYRPYRLIQFGTQLWARESETYKQSFTGRKPAYWH